MFPGSGEVQRDFFSFFSPKDGKIHSRLDVISRGHLVSSCNEVSFPVMAVGLFLS